MTIYPPGGLVVFVSPLPSGAEDVAPLARLDTPSTERVRECRTVRSKWRAGKWTPTCRVASKNPERSSRRSPGLVTPYRSRRVGALGSAAGEDQVTGFRTTGRDLESALV
jgi:hypothetical protein